MVDDAALVADALAKGAEAFAPIVRRYQSAVFSVALARVGNFHDAEDIAQAVFVDAFLRPDRLEDTGRLGAWLRTMAINKSIDRLRRRRHSVDVELIANDPQHAEMHSALQGDELRDQVMEAMGRLGRAQRETITLHYLSGYSVAEIARIQNAPVGTVKARLHHGRKALKREVMEMVESTLESEGPPEDLAQRVFEVLSRHDRHEYDLFRELRRLGAGNAMEGFTRAAEAPSAETRRVATRYGALFATEEGSVTAIELIQRGLRDPNRGVRSGAVRAAFDQLPCSDEVRRQQLVLLVVDLLLDASKDVRQGAAGHLQDWAAEVPLETAARALLEEPNRNVRRTKEELLRAVLDQRSAPCPGTGGYHLDDQLTRFEEDLRSPRSAVRAKALMKMHMPKDHPVKARRVLRQAVEMLRDPARRVRQRAAYELWPWAADVPAEAVESALRAETNTRARRSLERLLQRVKEQLPD